MAKDVCECLELGNPRTSVALLDDDEKGVHTMDTVEAVNTHCKKVNDFRDSKMLPSAFLSGRSLVRFAWWM